jgi:hypothetical protein
MDLIVDGNIAQMFSPEGASRFFACLLGMDPWSLRPTLSQERLNAFFITSSDVQSARPSLAINGRPLDYAITSLNMPAFFVHNDRVTLGLPLLEAVNGGCVTLLGADDMAPIGNGSTMYIRINVGILSF